MTEVKKATGQAQGSQMRITEDEMALIKSTFGGNEQLLRLMRKMFLPELDPSAPIGQMIDLWMTLKIDELPIEEAIINLKARNTVITHVDQVLMQLKLISGLEIPTKEGVEAKAKKDSAK